MRSTRIVTSFIRENEKLLILKRSEKVKSMKGLWSGVSGIIEKDEMPLHRAITEIFEEVGIVKEDITLLKSAKEMRVDSPQYKNHEWWIYPFLFEMARPATITLNWENSEYRWIYADELSNFETVPNLCKVLLDLL